MPMIHGETMKAVQELLQERGVEHRPDEPWGDYVARGLHVSDAKAGAFLDALRQLLALRAEERLRVVDAADGARVGGHDDGACDDGARERAPSDFIDSGEKGTARGAQFLLECAPAARHCRSE